MPCFTFPSVADFPSREPLLRIHALQHKRSSQESDDTQVAHTHLETHRSPQQQEEAIDAEDAGEEVTEAN